MKTKYHRITAPLGRFMESWQGYIAAGLLAVMFLLGLTSMVGNSAIVDEVAHIPAAYSYVHYGDYRLNPEHPPLIKDLAGIPLQFMNLKFPDTEPAWTTDINGQWESGWNFIYHLGNDADRLIFWARLPIFLLAIGFGVFLFLWARKRWSVGVALLALTFYAFSPNILAHSTLVTTDLGASVFIFLALVGFVRFVENPTGKNLFIMSLGLGVAQLAKFSAFLLYPFLLVVTLLAVWILRDPKKAMDRLAIYTGGLIASSALSILWVWIFYIPQTINMPVAVQDRLIDGSLPASNMHLVVQILHVIDKLPIFNALAQYILGLAMVYGRVTGGNVTYFNGMVTNQSYHGYFPETFAFKTQVAFLILMLLALLWWVWRYLAIRQFAPLGRVAQHMRTHIMEWVLGGFAAFYFGISVAGNLNLGVRHILPIYIPLFVLIAVFTVNRLHWLETVKWHNSRMYAGVGVAVLLVWYAASTVLAAPYFLSYFNELIGGPANADKYFSDSSVDWGQDLKHLKMYVDQHPEINHIAVDYFGGGVPEYYFCQRQYDAKGAIVATAAGYDCTHSKMEEWHSQYGPYQGQYIAVSETFLENDKWYSELNNTPGYEYLRERTPIAKIGYSIYLYKLY